MKAEHRKELVTNDLADWVGNLIQHPKESISPKVYWVLGGAAVIGILIFPYRYFSGTSTERDSERWTKFLTMDQSMAWNGEKDELENYAKDYRPPSRAGRPALRKPGCSCRRAC